MTCKPNAAAPTPKPQRARQPHLEPRRVSPSELARDVARRRYTYAAFFLGLILVSFVVQTELSAYIQGELGWDKAYCMLYLTHGSWSFLWPVQLMILRFQKRDLPWDVFWRRHVQLLRSTAAMVQLQRRDVDRASVMQRASPVRYLVRATAGITTALTIAGLSWYIAVSMTSPSDLTAIYNCSAFFAYAFSVPLLKEPLRQDKSIAVAIAIVGVLVVAYGDAPAASDSDPDGGDSSPTSSRRFFAVCLPSRRRLPGRGTIFANAFGSLIGVFTLLVLWIPLPILHITGLETFVLPTGRTAFLLLLSVTANATFAGSFLVLISLTSPVLSSVASLLTIFVVAIVDWLFTGKPLGFASILGGALITVAFLMLSWSTWREMSEHAERKASEYERGQESNSDEEEEEP
ncbi:unnamed protein product [Parascedosporium putredinis]|uniref:EamA domain-containing protein n=1 Tax=Parascedosporium putredinis TaxID=1442378 RepID=A0A9P1H4T7_9PEZI|nr:unnamed protein product [Parascedosporium putredinis]CAI7995818.1 unnamed protein product [Parascedosporium putredinis]